MQQLLRLAKTLGIGILFLQFFTFNTFSFFNYSPSSFYNFYSHFTVSPDIQLCCFCILQSNNGDFQKKFPSKSCPLRYGAAKIKEDAFKLFDFSLKEFISPQGAAWGVTSLSVTASKFLAIPSVSFIITEQKWPQHNQNHHNQVLTLNLIRQAFRILTLFLFVPT